MIESYTTSIIADRWQEAVDKPDYARWRSLAEWCAQLADAIEHNEPDSIMVPALRGVYEAAYGRMLAMLNKEKAA